MSDFEARVAAFRERALENEYQRRPNTSHYYGAFRKGFDAAAALYRDEIARLEADYESACRGRNELRTTANALQVKLDAISTLHHDAHLFAVCMECADYPCPTRRIIGETPQPAPEIAAKCVCRHKQERHAGGARECMAVRCLCMRYKSEYEPALSETDDKR